MTRGDAVQNKVHYKGKDEDFLVFVDSPEDYQKYKKDQTTPLAHVVSTFKIFVTHKHGAQGVYDGASKSVLANEFGDDAGEEDVIKRILLQGSLQESQMSARDGVKNDSMGGLSAP